MPVNRNALIRYKTIDLCLQNRYRKWTLDDLIDACSDALYEYEGIMKGVSQRTVQMDIQMMRSDKLGYNAPIVVVDKKYYTYEDADYSIMNIPLSENDLDKLMETVDFLKQFKGFSHFRELDGMVQKLEDHIFSRKTHRKPVIDFEKNENLKGLEFLDVIYKAIVEQKAIALTYQSFKARQPGVFNFHPYLLKEFRNRWFVVGAKKAKDPLLTLALDRIACIKDSEIAYIKRDDFNAEDYFKDAIGVTVSPGMATEKVTLFVNHKHAPYVLTKPIHHSQKVVERDDYGVTITLDVQLNFELEKEILGLGDGIMVLAPESLKRSVTERLNNAVDLYNISISTKGIVSLKYKLIHKGYAVINHMYTRRSLRQMGLILHKNGLLLEKDTGSRTIDIDSVPALKQLVINKNVERIARQISENTILKELECHEFVPDDMLEWNQTVSDEKYSMIFFPDNGKFKSFTIQLVPGSHNKLMQQEEKMLIIENCVPVDCEIHPGGAVLLNPLLIKRFSDVLKEKKIRFFVLKFR